MNLAVHRKFKYGFVQTVSRHTLDRNTFPLTCDAIHRLHASMHGRWRFDVTYRLVLFSVVIRIVHGKAKTLC